MSETLTLERREKKKKKEEFLLTARPRQKGISHLC